jgi:hypothetical protein
MSTSTGATSGAGTVYTLEHLNSPRLSGFIDFGKFLEGS